MATFRTCIFSHQRRADGTYNIKLRITHHRKSRWISTTLYALPDDLTRGLKIKDEKLSRKCRELVEDCIDLCNDMGYAVEEMEIDELVARIKSGLKGGERFRLDFIAYMRQEAARMNSGTASIYMTALNALRRYIGRDTLDIGEITAPFIKGFVQFIESEPSQRGANRKQKGETATKNKGNRALSLYISRIKTIYNRAKEEFNDEELGQMNILGNPFRNLRLETPAPGMNSADLLTCPPARKDEIVYFRQKTASRRTDRAEMHVRIEPCVSPLIARYSDKTGKRLLHFYLRYKDRVSFNKAINKGLKDVGEAIGVDGLTFYAARHSWATIARTPREEGGAGLDKYVIHEALNHVDTSMKVTDIYLVKNWRVIFDANKAVMNLFDWSGIGK